MPSFVSQVRWIAVAVAAGLVLTSGIFGLSSWQRWRDPQLTAAGFADRKFLPFEMIVPEHATRDEVLARYAQAAAMSLAQERARGRSGLLLAALGAATGTGLLIVLIRVGRTRT